MKDHRDTRAIKQAVKAAGSQTRLAHAIDAPPAMVSQWVKGTRPVPIIYCLGIERATGVSRRDLRPADWHKIWSEE